MMLPQTPYLAGNGADPTPQHLDHGTFVPKLDEPLNIFNKSCLAASINKMCFIE